MTQPHHRPSPLATLLCGLGLLLSATAAHAAGPVTLKASQISSLGVQSVAVQGPAQSVQRFPAQLSVPATQQRVVAAPVAGIVEALSVNPGDTVRQGQWLVRLRSQQLQELGRDVQQSGSQLDLARRTAQRDEALYQEGLIPLSRLEASRAQLAQQQAQAQERRQALALAGGSPATAHHGGGVSLSAPMSGHVLERLVAVGERVDAMTPLYRIAALDPLWVEIQVPAQLAAGIRLGDAVDILGTGSPKAPTGEVIALGATVDPHTQTVMVRARIQQARAASLRPGQLVEAGLRTSASGPIVVNVPGPALLSAPGGVHQVFVDQGQGRYLLTPVHVVSQSGQTASVTGLPAGTRVVIHGTSALKALLGN